MASRTQGSCFGSSWALFCWCYASPPRSFVPQRAHEQARAQLHNHSNSCSSLYYPYFSFLTFNPVMHTFHRSFLWAVTGKQHFFFHSTKTFSVFRDIYSNTATTGSKPFVLWSPVNICNTEGSNSSVSRNKMLSLWLITHPAQGTKEIDNNEISPQCCSPGRYARPKQVLTFKRLF